jgi:hypothetical protein
MFCIIYCTCTKTTYITKALVAEVAHIEPV